MEKRVLRRGIRRTRKKHIGRFQGVGAAGNGSPGNFRPCAASVIVRERYTLPARAMRSFPRCRGRLQSFHGLSRCCIVTARTQPSLDCRCPRPGDSRNGSHREASRRRAFRRFRASPRAVRFLMPGADTDLPVQGAWSWLRRLASVGQLASIGLVSGLVLVQFAPARRGELSAKSPPAAGVLLGGRAKGAGRSFADAGPLPPSGRDAGRHGPGQAAAEGATRWQCCRRPAWSSRSRTAGRELPRGDRRSSGLFATTLPLSGSVRRILGNRSASRSLKAASGCGVDRAFSPILRCRATGR